MDTLETTKINSYTVSDRISTFTFSTKYLQLKWFCFSLIVCYVLSTNDMSLKHGTMPWIGDVDDKVDLKMFTGDKLSFIPVTPSHFSEINFKKLSLGKNILKGNPHGSNFQSKLSSER